MSKHTKLPSQNASAGKDLLAGSVAGAVQLCVGHPFDTVKVIMQQSTGGVSMGSAVRTIYRESGFRGYFRGISSPLAFVAMTNAAMFSAGGVARTVLGGSGATASDLTVMQNALSGAFAGVCVAAIAGPTELVKCRMQVAPTGAYSGTMDCARSIFNAKGVRGLFLGMEATLAREVSGTALMFGVYEGVKRSFMKLGDRDYLTPAEQLASGAIGGFSFWSTVYPVDNLKTRIQTDCVENPRFGGSLVKAGKSVIAEEGIGALYRGLTPCLIRSMVANAVLFSCYERVSSIIKDM